jgi:hypothetical protein
MLVGGDAAGGELHLVEEMEGELLAAVCGGGGEDGGPGELVFAGNAVEHGDGVVERSAETVRLKQEVGGEGVVEKGRGVLEQGMVSRSGLGRIGAAMEQGSRGPTEHRPFSEPVIEKKKKKKKKKKTKTKKKKMKKKKKMMMMMKKKKKKKKKKKFLRFLQFAVYSLQITVCSLPLI